MKLRKSLYPFIISQLVGCSSLENFVKEQPVDSVVEQSQSVKVCDSGVPFENCEEVKTYKDNKVVANHSHEVTLQKLWGFDERGRKLSGLEFALTDLDGFAQFNLSVYKTKVSNTGGQTNEFEIPEGITASIEYDGVTLGQIDLSGLQVLEIEEEYKRTDFFIHPSILLRVYDKVFNPDWKRNFQMRLDARAGVGYEINTWIEKTDVNISILENDEGFDSISLPLTDSGNRESLTLDGKLDFTVGIVNGQFNFYYVFPKGVKVLYGVGVKW